MNDKINITEEDPCGYVITFGELCGLIDLLPHLHYDESKVLCDIIKNAIASPCEVFIKVKDE